MHLHTSPTTCWDYPGLLPWRKVPHPHSAIAMHMSGFLIEPQRRLINLPLAPKRLWTEEERESRECNICHHTWRPSFTAARSQPLFGQPGSRLIECHLMDWRNQYVYNFEIMPSTYPITCSHSLTWEWWSRKRHNVISANMKFQHNHEQIPLSLYVCHP